MTDAALALCSRCCQMTNHVGNVCLKCKPHDRICERAATCDLMNSDGEPCRHGTPHAWDQGCEIVCRAKTPFSAVCTPNAAPDRAAGETK